MTKLMIIGCLITTLSFAASKPVHFKIYSFTNTQVGTPEIKSGIGLFITLLKEHCSIPEHNFAFLPHEQKIFGTGHVIPFTYSSDWKKDPESDYTFNTYMLPLYKLIQQHQNYFSSKTSREISIIKISDLSNHCAFSFPEVQFMKPAPKPGFSKIVNQLKNTIIISAKQIENRTCPGIPRLIAHELAHVFIQDNPPHTCPTPSGKSTCPSDNLLSKVRIIRPSFRPGIPGPPSPNIPLDPELEAERTVPSTGTHILPAQCKRIKKYLLKLRSK